MRGNSVSLSQTTSNLRGWLLAGLLAVPCNAQCQYDWNTDLGQSIGLVNDAVMHDDGLGGGETLYVGGWFTRFGHPPSGSTLPPAIRSVAKLGPSGWEALLPGLGTYLGLQPGRVVAVASFNGELYAGGNFVQPYTGPGQSEFNPPFTFNNIARWTGTQWLPLGSSGLSAAGLQYAPDTYVRCFHVHDDGSGSKLYIGGDFTYAGGLYSSALARWDGQAWSTINPATAPGIRVSALCTYDDDGDGPNPPYLYVGGSFDTFEGIAAHGLIRWNGTAWSAVPGWSPIANSGVYSLAVYDSDGDGPSVPKLYIGGQITNWIAQPEPSGNKNLACWDGSQFTFPITIPFHIGSGAFVTAMAAGHEGSQPVLYMGTEHWTFQGYQGFLDAIPYSVMRYDGQTTTTVGGGLGNPNAPAPEECCDFPIFAGVYSMLPIETPEGPGLFMGGGFNELDFGTTAAKNMVVWKPTARSADYNGDGGVTIDDLLEYLGAFNAGVIEADFNGDAGVTIDDLLGYLASFNLGC